VVDWESNQPEKVIDFWNRKLDLIKLNKILEKEN